MLLRSYIMTSGFMRLQKGDAVACEWGGVATQAATMSGAGLAVLLVATGVIKGEL